MALEGSFRETRSQLPGSQPTYSDLAIEAALTIRRVFHLPLSQSAGFLRSLADLLEVELPIPDHTTLSQRLKKGDGHRVRVLIPPIQGAQPSSSPSPGQWERNRNIRSVRKLGRRERYDSSGYSRRSLAENAVFRCKAILGQHLRSRSLPNQRVEVQLASKILNTMTSLGMPDSYGRREF